MKTEKNLDRAEELYPGVDIDSADDNKVTECLERERTKTLNDNPRNTDDKM